MSEASGREKALTAVFLTEYAEYSETSRLAKAAPSVISVISNERSEWARETHLLCRVSHRVLRDKPVSKDAPLCALE
jgi:hypothetical protein